MPPPDLQAFVVAIAGPPGAGKSAAVRALAARVPGSSIVAYDRFQTLTSLSIEELAAWEAAGADCNRFELTPLVQELELRKRSGAALVIFETPLGRSHRATAGFIDCLVWLQTPLDVALARAVAKIVADNVRAGTPAARTQQWLLSYLASYRQLLWRLYRRQSQEVAPAAELSVSGMESPPVIAEAILRHLRRTSIASLVDDDPRVE